MSRRTEQVGDEVQRVLGEIILTEMKDPRLGFVTITGVTMTPDLQRANVQVAIMGDAAERKATLQILERAKGFLRHRLGEEVQLRVVPQLVLHLDTSLDNALRITDVLRTIEDDRIANPPRFKSSADEEADQYADEADEF